MLMKDTKKSNEKEETITLKFKSESNGISRVFVVFFHFFLFKSGSYRL